MTNMSQLAAPAIAKAYGFNAWGSLMDVGGGNGILLSHILLGTVRASQRQLFGLSALRILRPYVGLSSWSRKR